MDKYLLLDRCKWNDATDLDREDVVSYLMETKLKTAFDYLGLKEFSCGGSKNNVAIFRHKATKMTFHLLAGGTFNFGAGENITQISELYSEDLAEDGGNAPIQISPFLISTYLITEFAWRRFDGPKLWKYYGDAHAADAIERAAVSFWAKKIGANLPSEVEWEYACKAGTDSIFYWGQNPSLDHAWTNDNTVFNDDYKPRTAAEQKLPNAFGLLGMIGNIGEWVADDAYDLGSEVWHNLMDSTPGAIFRDENSATPDGILRGGWDDYGWKFNRSTSRIKCGLADGGCSARIIFTDLLQGEMTPYIAGKSLEELKTAQQSSQAKVEQNKSPNKLIDIARESAPQSTRYQPGKAAKLFSYRMKGTCFSSLLNFGAGSEKEESAKSHHIDCFEIETMGIDQDLKLRSGTAQVIWEDYVRGITHDGLSVVYWSFYEMLARSFFGNTFETKLNHSDILALSKLGGSFRNNPGPRVPSYCQAIDGLTVFSIYRENFKTARESAEELLSPEGFGIFANWMDSALSEDEDLILFRVVK